MSIINGYQCDPGKGLIYGKRAKRAIGRVNGRGYVEISSSGIAGLAHRMIWESVHGPIPLGLQINHINGIKTDNRIENLELVTPSENTSHAYKTGLTSALGERNGRAKLSAFSVRIIRRRASSESTYKLAAEYGVSRRAIRDVVSGRNWSQVK